jgi:hypothetical protein
MAPEYVDVSISMRKGTQGVISILRPVEGQGGGPVEAEVRGGAGDGGAAYAASR